MTGTAGAGPFPADALDANRQGRLTDAQRKTWRGVDRRWGGTVILMALVFAIAGVFLLAGIGNAPVSGSLRMLAGAACLVGAAVLAYVSVLGGGQLTRDLRDGRVEAAEGAISRERGVQGSAGDPGHAYLHVDGRRLVCTRTIYDAAPEAGIVRVYFLPRSRRVVNLERLPDRPLPEGAFENPSEVVGQVARELGSHDRERQAEAMATMAAMKDAVAGPGSPPPAGQADTRPLAEAIVGAWHGPLMNVTFAADGTATAAMATGMHLAGRWSVAGDGKLHLTGMGEDMVTEASVAGDALSLVMDGERMAFRRA
jgi:hypothetical protein